MSNVPMPEVPNLSNPSVEDIVAILTQMILTESVFVPVIILDEALLMARKVKDTLTIVNNNSPEKMRVEKLVSDLEERIKMYNKVVSDFGHIVLGVNNA
ncbi:hypothetical protein SEA_ROBINSPARKLES_84 [Gordonia phage RobinSparkles]|nr:hypothetical protein SEA_ROBINSPARKLES_84 [Gordonia phage RobinSparkles]